MNNFAALKEEEAPIEATAGGSESENANASGSGVEEPLEIDVSSEMGAPDEQNLDEALVILNKIRVSAACDAIYKVDAI